jgi:hypothetical protein
LKHYVFMYEKGTMKPVETALRSGADKRER